MKGILLLSGGIDSPVAAYLMKEKGVDLISVTFVNELFSEDDSEIKTAKISKILGIKKQYLINHGSMQAEVSRKCDRRYFYILTRRIMWRVAEKIAEKENADFLVTGENLGQVGSQTVSNMANISKAVKLEILRPILCNDKMDTIEIAKKIGTYEISKGPEICSVFGPKNPATKSKIESIEHEEKRLDVDKLVRECLESMKVISG